MLENVNYFSYSLRVVTNMYLTQNVKVKYYFIKNFKEVTFLLYSLHLCSPARSA